MRVLQFGKFYPPSIGGTEKVIYLLTEELNRQGIKCDVLCSNEKYEYKEEILNSYKVFRTKSFGKIASTSISPQMIFKLKELAPNYDLIHIHMPDPMANLAYFLVKPKTKLVIQWHMDIVRQKFLLPLYKPLLLWLFKRADLVLISSKKLLTESDFSCYFKHKAEVLPLPFDPDELTCLPLCQETEKRIKELSKGRKIILFVGRLVYYKGVHVLIQAVKDIPDEAVVFIVGEGPLKNSLQNLINKLNLKQRVFLLGKANNEALATFYQHCYLFCLPSTHKTEAFGIVQLEAMSFGKPVISTQLSASGVCEVNVDGETGLCVPPGNVNALSSAIKLLLNEKEIYEKMSKNAKERVKHFHKSVIVKKLISCYNNLTF